MARSILTPLLITTGGSIVTSSSATSIPFILRGATGQTSDLLQFQNDSNTVFSGMTSNGLIYSGASSPTRFINFTLTAASASSTTVATYTTSSSAAGNPVSVGQKVIVSSVTPSSYNGSFVVTSTGGSSGAWTFTVTAPSAPFTVGSATAFGTFALDAALYLKTPSVGASALILHATTNQNAYILEYRDSSNTLKSYMTSAGDFVAPAISSTWSITSSASSTTVTPIRARWSVANATTNAQTWENSTTILAGVNPQGQIFTGSITPIQGSATVAINTQTPTGTTNITITTASAHGISVGQTVVIAGITPSGYNGTWTAQSGTTGSTLIVNIGSNPGAITGAGTVTQNSQVGITASSSTNIPLVIKGASSQGSNLTEWQNSGGTVIARVDSNGSLRSTVSVFGNTVETNSGYTSIREANSGGMLQVTKQTAAANNPGAGVGRIYFRDGTTGGTLKLAAITGAFGIEETIVDNISSTGSTAGAQFVGAGGVNTAGAISTSSTITAGSDISTSAYLKSNYSSGNEGGEIFLAAPAAANTSITNGVTIDVYQNKLRFFEQGGSARGFYIDITTGGAGVGTNLVGGGGGGTTTYGLTIGTTGLTATSGTSPFNGSAAVTVDIDTTKVPTLSANNVLTGSLTLRQGSTTASTAPLYFNATGTSILTTPVSGALEYDSIVFYKTANTTPGRALDTQSYYYIHNSTYNLDFSGAATAQSILGGTTTGITLAAGTTYEFELYVAVQHQYVSSTSMALSHGWTATTVSGAPTTSFIQYLDYSNNTTGFTTAATKSSVRTTTTTVTISTAITTGSRYSIYIGKGTIRVTGTGTVKVYPHIVSSAIGDNAVAIQTGTYLKLTPIGNGTVTTVGTWA